MRQPPSCSPLPDTFAWKREIGERIKLFGLTAEKIEIVEGEKK